MCEYEKKIPVYDIKIIVDDAILVDSKLKPYYEIMYRKVWRKQIRCIKDGDLKMKNATLENLINHRDECMKEVYGESYEELFKTMDKVVNNLGDILDKIFK